MNELQSINLVNSIRKLVNNDTSNNMIFGKVVSVDPLKISIGNNIVLTKKFLYLGQMCRPFKVTIPHTHKYNGNTETTSLTTTATIGASATVGVIAPNPHKHEIKNQETNNVYNENKDVKGEDYDYVIAEIYPKLKKDDIVLMFSMNGNQMYYVAERIEPQDNS